MLKVIYIILLIISTVLPIFNDEKIFAESNAPSLILTEIKVRSDTTDLNDLDEYIEIYNASDASVDLAQFTIEYYNIVNPTDSTQPTQKTLPATILGSQKSLVFAKQQRLIPNSQPSLFSSLADAGGRLKLTTNEGLVLDEIAWSNSQSSATGLGVYPQTVYQCNSSTLLCNGNRALSISRGVDADGKYILEIPTWALLDPSPVSDELEDYPDTEVPPVETPPTPEPPSQPPTKITCEGIIISEVLPNPSGVDTGNEFIELYNPTSEVINLDRCSLQTSSSTKIFNLPASEMQPGEYRSFYDSSTGLVLPNSAGGSVWLLSPQEELARVLYPGELADDVSWSLVDNYWQQSYVVTPSRANTYAPYKPCESGQFRSLETGRCQTPVAVTIAQLTPCKEGQERNPETNRCRNIEEVSVSLVACKEGQVRNPDTNRCRNVISNSSALTPCKEGQERNPETNRCRNIAGSSSDLQPCAEGQERNPETNRCRKIAGTSSSNGKTLGAVTDVRSDMKTSPKWWLAIMAIILAMGYAVYEWRRDIGQLLVGVRQRFSRS